MTGRQKRTMTEQKGFIKVLKWIVFLPASLIGGYVAWYLVALLNKITMIFYINPKSFFARLFVESVSNMVWGAATVFIASWIVPSYKKQVSAAMCGLIILVAGICLFPAIMKPDYWAIYANIMLVIGASVTAYTIFTGETDVGQIEKDHERTAEWME